MKLLANYMFTPFYSITCHFILALITGKHWKVLNLTLGSLLLNDRVKIIVIIFL